MNLKEIDDAIEEGISLKTIAQAYSEIANLKLKNIRAAAERNRLFFQEIASVYGLVKQIAATRKVVLQKSKKTVALIITSNYRFYGNINSSLIEYFVKNTEGIEMDRVIVGKVGIDHFKTTNTLPNLIPVMLKGDHPDTAELNALINIIKDYNQVLVFYTRIKTLLVQTPQVMDITASSQNIEEATGEKFRFIFEPELPKILAFFDSQILTLLLEATFLESEVSRTASRFISMDQAETEANKFIKEYKKVRAYTVRNKKNNQLLEGVAALRNVHHE